LGITEAIDTDVIVYLNDADAIKASFDERDFFRTGDRVVMLPSGAIRFESRVKDMLKVGGENVASAEIERVPLAVPGVTRAAVVGRPDPIRDEVPVAFVDVAPGTDAVTIRGTAITAIVEQLADFKVPRFAYVFEDLPEALIGKIAKATLREWALDRMAAE
jgi:crotonobetaine/carnitine-CoA ligase